MSNAFEKSSTARSTCFPTSNEERILCVVVGSWVSHEYSMGEDVLLLKGTQEMTTDYVFKDFAGDRCEGDWAVVLGKVPVTFLEDA